MRPRASRSSWALCLIVLLVCAGALVARYDSNLLATHYYVKTVPYRIVVAAHSSNRAGAQTAGDELLLLVQSSTQGWRGSKLEAALMPVGAWLGFVRDTPEPLQPRTELLRLRPAAKALNGALERREVNNLSGYGSFFNAAGTLYYLAPDDADDDEDEGAPPADSQQELSGQSERGWRWDGAQFVAITPELARQFEQQQLQSRRRAAQAAEQSAPTPAVDNDWTLCQLSPFSSVPAANCALTLAGERWWLGAQTVRPLPENFDFTNYQIPLRLRLINMQTGAAHVLVDEPDAWTETTPARFAALIDARTVALRGRYFGRRFTPLAGFTTLFWLVFIGYLPCHLLRRALLRVGVPSNYYPDARPEQFPALALPQLEHYTSELLARGFVHLRDFTLTPPRGQRTPPFGRLFAHPELKCYAEIGQLFPNPRSAVGQEFSGLHIAFITPFAEQGWRLAVTNREPDVLSYQLRRPRALFLCRPDLPLAQLFEAHLDVRRQMLNRLNLHLPAEVRASLYHAGIVASLTERHALLARRTRLLLPFLFEHSRLKSRRHYHWLGDYGLRPAPVGWTPPQMRAAAQAARFHETGESRAHMPPGFFGLLRPWVELLSLTTNIVLWLNLYLWCFHPTHQRNVNLAHLGITIVGLGLLLLVWLSKRRAPFIK